MEADKVAGWKRNGVLTTANGTGAPAGSLGFVSNQQVTTTVKGTKNSIGYFDFADAKAQGIKSFAAVNGTRKLKALTTSLQSLT